MDNFNLEEADFHKIKTILSNVRWDKLYDSKIHGKYHSKKVFLFSYLIAKVNNFNEDDLTIISDAAIYHDMGRINDYEETLHGYASTLKVEEVLTSDIYKDGENLQHLMAIIEAHSVSDERRDFFYNMHDLTEHERYIRLYNVLKDADALDRYRFYETCNAFLDERFLRTEASKKLIDFSKQINEIYKNEITNNINKNIENDSNEKCSCFHSIGFDFFKINSILENGILSKKEMKKMGIEGTSNFQGGNLDDYISVVDANLIDSNGSAFKTFIMNGVSFICNVNKLYSSNNNHTKSYCIEHGLPYNHSFHEDEKYVRGKIPKDNITCVYIPNSQRNRDIRELSYIYNSLSYENFYNRIKHYYDNVPQNARTNLNKLDNLLEQYKIAIEKYMFLDGMGRYREEKNITNKLENLRSSINIIIQEWLYNNYANELGINDNSSITVEDVVVHEINKLDYDSRIEKNKSGIVIYIGDELVKSNGRR